MSLKPGTRLRAAPSTCEVLVIRTSSTGEVLTCAGGEMRPNVTPGERTAIASPVLLGKRYADECSGLEVLCVRPGSGPLCIGDRELVVRTAKPLPASD
jgi:hypothetical protein